MKVNEIITSKFLEALNRQEIPWRQPWNVFNPTNVISKKPYRGVNWLLCTFLGHDDFFLTFKQMQSLGGTLKKGSKAIPITFYTKLEKETGKIKKDGKLETQDFRILRYYQVFNANDCEGLDWTRPTDGKIEFIPIEKAEKLLTGCQVPIFYEGIESCFYPTLKKITMPRKENFHSVEDFYASIFHEVGHSLRLEVEESKVEGVTKVEKYSKEELVAEIFSAFCMNHCNLPFASENSLEYVRGWASKLEQDPQLIISASSKAQKRFDYLLKACGEVMEESQALALA